MNLITYLNEQAKFELDEKKALNTAIWKKDAMHPEVKAALMKIADAFVEFVGTKLNIVDIIVTGSLANYTWHSKSDVDLHIVVKENKDACQDTLKELYGAKKALWNAEHDITIKGFPVELYVQPADEPHASSGVYSLKNDEWVKKPKKSNPVIDDSYVIHKANKWKTKIDHLVSHHSDNLASIEALKKRLRDVRKMGLDKDGEFSVENLAFKILRNDGYIEKLFDYATEVKDNNLSLD